MTVPRAIGGSRRRVFAAVVVGLGAGLSWVLAPVMSLTFDDSTSVRLPWAPDAWLPVYERVYEGLDRGGGLSAYHFWGRFTVLAYLAGLVGGLFMVCGRGRTGRIGRLLLIGGFAVGLVGDAVAYWRVAGGTPAGLLPSMTQQAPPDLDDLVIGVGFLAESIAGVGLLVGLALLGIGHIRAAGRASLLGFVLVTGAVAAFPISLFVIDYVPHGFLVVVLTCLAVALLLVEEPAAAVARPAGPEARP